MNEILIAVGAILTTGGTGFFTYLFMKSKYKQEVEKLKIEVIQAKESAETTAIDNDIKLSGHYRDMLDDLKLRYENRFKEYEEIMLRKYKLLEEEVKLMVRKNKLQADEIRELRRENAELRKRPPHVTPSFT